MGVRALKYNAIRAKNGKYTHAFSYQSCTTTVCGIAASGWLCATTPLDCPRCIAGIEAHRRGRS